MTDPRFLQFTLSVDHVATEGWRVRHFEVIEALSEGLRGEVVIDRAQAGDVPALVGKSLALGVEPGDGTDTRWFHGVVMSVTRGTRGLVTVSFVSRVELARVGRDTRIFHDKSAVEIVGEVFDKAGLARAMQRWTVGASYRTRPYTAQFNESDYDFARRMLADEGIAFAVRNAEDGESVVFFDDDAGIEAVAGDSLFIDRRAAAQSRARSVRHLREMRRGVSDAVVLRDYDPTQPGADLTRARSAEGSTGREVYRHPGGFTQTAQGDRRAQRLLEAIGATRRTIAGTTDGLHLEPGHWFSIEGAPRAALNGDLLIVSVVHRGHHANDDEPSVYENDFVAIPKGVPFRPREAAPQPVVGGVHVAFVTGPTGRELHGSERGEVRARFPWDRSGITDDRSSWWMRVGQLALGGPMVIPRVGFEVLVDHEMGDLDRPVVVGHLYNGERRPPYELPAHAARSTIQTATTDGGAGANELRFDDTAGSEEIFANASQDYTCSVENNAGTSVGANESSDVGANQVTSVTADDGSQVTGDRTLRVGGNQTVNVGGDLSDGTGGSSSLSVGATRDVTVGGDHTENTTSTLSRDVGGLQSVTGVGGVARKIVGSSSTTVGGVWMEMCAASRASTCGGSRTETVGGLKMIKAKTVSVACSAAYAMNCATEAVKCGGSRTDKAAAVALNIGGGVKVQATDINITGQSKVVLRAGGTTITVTPSSVVIKSGRATLKGVKQLKSSASHDSG